MDSDKLQKYTTPIDHPFRCTTALQLRYNDYDMQGRVNNGTYYNYFDLAKMDYFRKVRDRKFNWEELSVVMASAKTDFFVPINYYENIVVLTQCTHIGNKSLTLAHRIINSDTQEVKCQCSQVLVYINRKTGLTEPLPTLWRQAITTYEAGE
ncbi:MAG: thioesterase family protein [Bacteroidales bacterium]|nr:thioesterase family protein [Bacteroidales bacterium]